MLGAVWLAGLARLCPPYNFCHATGHWQCVLKVCVGTVCYVLSRAADGDVADNRSAADTWTTRRVLQVTFSQTIIPVLPVRNRIR